MMPFKKQITVILINLIGVIFSSSITDKKYEPADRKNTLYMNLGIYTPGTKLAFGDPLQASKIIADE